MLLSYNAFSTFITVSILAAIMGAIVLLLMLIFERELDLLNSRNLKLELEKELQQMQYIQLGQQIQPHFLFNTLNLLLSLARLKKSNELIKALENLSIFLRSGYQTKGQFAKLASEVQSTLSYLEIQQMRFGQRLIINLNIPDELNETSILPYLLQTLVENAFKHGLEKKVGEAMLTISLTRQGDHLSLKVSDNGPGEIEISSARKADGQGLHNVQKRLALLFGDKASLLLTSTKGEGTEVLVHWPLINYSSQE